MYIFHIMKKTSINAAYIFHRFEKKCQNFQEGGGGGGLKGLLDIF